MKKVAVIMAGGRGERLWPMSTIDMPKQFIPLTSDHQTMLQLTVERISPLIKSEDIFIVTNASYKDIVFDQLPNLPRENVLLEPAMRNTAPCLALVTGVIKKRFGDAIVLVLAADHAIEKKENFLSSIKTAFAKAEEDCIVTIGMVPTRAETQYGYIEIAGGNKSRVKVTPVKRFVEKPSQAIAEEYFKSGNFLWNSGTFIWKNSHIEKCFYKYAPNIAPFISDFTNERAFVELPNISIDYAIMEKADNLFVVPADWGWDDVGSWLSIERLHTADENKNIITGKSVLYKGHNNIIINKTDKLVAATDVRDLVIVNTEKAILIINKNDIGNIKSLIKLAEGK